MKSSNRYDSRSTSADPLDRQAAFVMSETLHSALRVAQKDVALFLLLSKMTVSKMTVGDPGSLESIYEKLDAYGRQLVLGLSPDALKDTPWFDAFIELSVFTITLVITMRDALFDYVPADPSVSGPVQDVAKKAFSVWHGDSEGDPAMFEAEFLSLLFSD